MNLYVVKNDEGEYWDFEYDGWGCPERKYGSYLDTDTRTATSIATHKAGHVVELIEKPKPVEVPAWFDRWVAGYKGNLSASYRGYERAEDMATERLIGKVCQQGWGASANSELSNNSTKDKWNPFELNDAQVNYINYHKFTLVHALLDGYTVKREPRYNVKVPHAENWFYQIDGKAVFPVFGYPSDAQQFTLSELKQYGLQDLPREEANDDID